MNISQRRLAVLRAMMTPTLTGETSRQKDIRVNRRLLAAFLLWVATAISGWAQGSAQTIRVGAFPNITHAQAMVGKANGWFEKVMRPQVKVQWTSFNAGPSAIEALFAGAIDMTYVGPNPAINGFVRSSGQALRVVAGGRRGGALPLPCDRPR